MAVKFSQFLAESLTSPSFLVGYNSSTNQNVKVSYADLLAALGGGGIGGSGTTNYVSKWTGANSLGNSQIFDNGSVIGINTASPLSGYNVTIQGTSTSRGIVLTGDGRTGGTSTTAGGIIRMFYNQGSNQQIEFASPLNSASIVIYPKDNVGAMVYATGGTGEMYLGNDGSGFGRINIKANGNILIGTTTDAGYKLDVVGKSRIDGISISRSGNSSIFVTYLKDAPTTVGQQNSAFGDRALEFGTGGALRANTGIGGLTMQYMRDGDNNVAVGVSALAGNGTQTNFNQNYNVGIGTQSGLSVRTGSAYNTFIGNRSGYGATTGTYNTFIGAQDVAHTGNGITTGSYNTIIGSNITGLSSSLSNTIILADGQGNIRQYIDSTGNVGIGTTSPAEKLNVFGNTTSSVIVKIQNASNGSIADSRLVVANDANNEGGFFLGSSTRTLDANTVLVYANKALRFMTNNTVSTGGTDPIIFQSGGSSTAQEAMRITATTRVLIGTTTDAGYKLDVNGTARVTGNTIIGTGGATTFTVTGGGINTSQIILADLTISRTSGPAFTFDGSTGNFKFRTNFQERFAIPFSGGIVFNEPGLNYDFRIEGDTDQNLFFVDASVDNIGMGTNTPNSSALLDISSTTKGFLPPRMTGAQAEAIATPAVGLMVFSTDGSGTTITSSGWWGYESSGWVKIN